MVKVEYVQRPESRDRVRAEGPGSLSSSLPLDERFLRPLFEGLQQEVGGHAGLIVKDFWPRRRFPSNLSSVFVHPGFVFAPTAFLVFDFAPLGPPFPFLLPLLLPCGLPLRFFASQETLETTTSDNHSPCR
jgi:hypothetical protein